MNHLLCAGRFPPVLPAAYVFKTLWSNQKSAPGSPKY